MVTTTQKRKITACSGKQDLTSNRRGLDKLLFALNKAAAMLLAAADEKKFENSLQKSMELMGRCVNADSVRILKNEMIDGGHCFVCHYEWFNDIGKQALFTIKGMAVPYSVLPDWKIKFERGKCLNGPVSEQSKPVQNNSIMNNIKSLLVIPVFIGDHFWGLVGFTDCLTERIFTEDEVNILRSASLMMVSAVNRNKQASQLFDMHDREHKQILNALERRDHLLNTVNSAATVLLQSEIGEFENGLYRCMAMVAEAVCVNRIRTWKNKTTGGKLYCTQLFEWSEDGLQQNNNDTTADISYSKDIPGWEKTLSRGDCINSIVRNMAELEKQQLLSRNIVSIFVVPVFVRNEFWGFVSYEECRNERLFTEDEQSVMRSASVFMASSWLRNDMTLNIHADAAKLEAVIENYPGIIWCVDQDNMITLFNGQYLHALGKKPSFFENKKLDDALYEERFLGIRESIAKTFSGGRQDFNTEVDGRLYRIRTTPIYDNNGTIVNIVGNFDDITERLRLQAELKAALKAAQDASRAKSNFLATMSHEMRTPLNAIIGLSELTLESSEMSGENCSNLKKINNAGMTLLTIVNDILDISKIEAGKFELIPVEYDILSLLNDTIAQSSLRIEEKPIKFLLNISKDLPSRLYGDDLRIKQILNNLLSNAFKYTREGTVELCVSCVREEEIVWITARIRDSGIGIRKEDMGSLFRNYAQMDTKANRKIEGTGLGLHITKRIVEMMGGSISAESEYGKGSVFTVTIQQKIVTGDVIGEDRAKSLMNSRYSDHKHDRNSIMARIKIPYARVLIVDDVVTNLDVAKGMMNPYGMHVDCVTSGREAIEIIRGEKVRYNAIFMDHMMPDMDGIETTRIIREEIGTEYAKTIPIIVLTANAIVGNEEMFLNKGFQAFISKPVDIIRLDAVIREWVRDKDLENKIANGQVVTERNKSRIDWKKFGIAESGINVNKGIERFGGDEKSFLSLLRSYMVNTPLLLADLKKFAGEDLDKYAVLVHGIKGSSMGICADKIGTKAEALEKAAAEGNRDFVKAANGDLIKDLDNLLDVLENMFVRIDSGSSKPKKDKPDNEALLKLFAACETYNMNDIDAAMEAIDQYKYEADGGLAVWLRENVDKLNFEEITARLSALKM